MDRLLDTGDRHGAGGRVCYGRKCCDGTRHCEVKLYFGGTLYVLDKQVSRGDMIVSLDRWCYHRLDTLRGLQQHLHLDID